jgi:hypothetical protein
MFSAALLLGLVSAPLGASAVTVYTDASAFVGVYWFVRPEVPANQIIESGESEVEAETFIRDAATSVDGTDIERSDVRSSTYTLTNIGDFPVELFLEFVTNADSTTEIPEGGPTGTITARSEAFSGVGSPDFSFLPSSKIFTNESRTCTNNDISSPLFDCVFAAGVENEDDYRDYDFLLDAGASISFNLGASSRSSLVATPISPVPLPASGVLLALGSGLLVLKSRRSTGRAGRQAAM